MSVYSVDFEATYEKGRDIKSLGQWKYLAHPDTDIYLVAIYGPNFAWVGHPSKAPWHRIAGHEWVSWNRTFDYACHVELVARGAVDPIHAPTWWHCAADLACFLQAPRSLEKGVAFLLDVRIDKTVLKDVMKGKRWNEATPAEQTRVAEYALVDAKACWETFDTHGHLMPPNERAVSWHTTMMCARGVRVSVPRLDEAEAKLKAALWEIEQAIPWANTLDAKGKAIPATSPKAIATACRAIHIEPPPNTSAKDEDFALWAVEFGDRAPFVKAVQDWRSANRVAKIVATLQRRHFDGWLPFNLKYGGAKHTLRWSGDAGFNPQNLSKLPIYGVDSRGLIIPDEGHSFLIGDLAQIEARVALWFVQDFAQLELIRGGMDNYEAHARATMGYTDPRPLKDVAPDTRQYAKCRVLALGFGMGGKKYRGTVKLWTGLDISLEDSYQGVADFRRQNPSFKAMWRKLEQAMHIDGKATGEFSMELPSGRVIRYFDVSDLNGWSGRQEMGGIRKNLYGGLLFENLVQGTARDIFALALLRLEAHGLPVHLHSHDEAVCQVRTDLAPAAALEMHRLLTIVPDWMPNFPIGAEVTVADRYCKS